MFCEYSREQIVSPAPQRLYTFDYGGDDSDNDKPAFNANDLPRLPEIKCEQSPPPLCVFFLCILFVLFLCFNFNLKFCVHIVNLISFEQKHKTHK